MVFIVRNDFQGRFLQPRGTGGGRFIEVCGETISNGVAVKSVVFTTTRLRFSLGCYILFGANLYSLEYQAEFNDRILINRLQVM